MAADPGVDLFRHPNHAGEPKHQRQRHGQRHAQADVPDAARAAMDASLGRDAMDGFLQCLAGQRGCHGGGACVRDGQEAHGVEPIEPGHDAHLESAERAVAVVEEDVAGVIRVHERRPPTCRGEAIRASFVPRAAWGEFVPSPARLTREIRMDTPNSAASLY